MIVEWDFNSTVNISDRTCYLNSSSPQGGKVWRNNVGKNLNKKPDNNFNLISNNCKVDYHYDSRINQNKNMAYQSFLAQKERCP